MFPHVLRPWRRAPLSALCIVYRVFAFGEMDVVMRFNVCPKCIHSRWDGSRCISRSEHGFPEAGSPGQARHFPKEDTAPLSEAVGDFRWLNWILRCPAPSGGYAPPPPRILP